MPIIYLSHLFLKHIFEWFMEHHIDCNSNVFDFWKKLWGKVDMTVAIRIAKMLSLHFLFSVIIKENILFSRRKCHIHVISSLMSLRISY